MDSSPESHEETTPLRVLIVEDDPLLRGLLQSGLSGLGFETQAVGSVAEALARVSSHDPHIVLADLNLGPGPSGLDLLWRMYHDRPHVKRIVLSSHYSLDLASGKDGQELPPETGYIVKRAVRNLPELGQMLRESTLPTVREFLHDEGVTISPEQAKVLALVGSGLDDEEIARERGVGAEQARELVTDTLHALGLDGTGGARVKASEMWHTGQVRVSGYTA